MAPIAFQFVIRMGDILVRALAFTLGSHLAQLAYRLSGPRESHLCERPLHQLESKGRYKINDIIADGATLYSISRACQTTEMIYNKQWQ